MGDTVYIYAAAPVSAILYKCKVTETGIPYDYQDGSLTIKALMKIRLLKRYKLGKFSFNKLKDEIKSTNLSFVTKEVISMGHKLSIQNNFKFDTKVFLESLNKYLNVNFTKLSDVTPSNLNSSKFKSRPRVQSYEDLSNKIHQDLASTNNKSYTIVSKDGNNFTSMSPGWKTAVIIDLILGYKNDNAPIIIDQPEDNLAIKYINEDLVKTIKEVKGKKQIILVSHNATIPMMADAQNIIYCKNESGF